VLSKYVAVGGVYELTGARKTRLGTAVHNSAAQVVTVASCAAYKTYLRKDGFDIFHRCIGPYSADSYWLVSVLNANYTECST